MTDSASVIKSKINIKSEESQILEKAESLRQLILKSSLTPAQILSLDDRLDGIIYNISEKYDRKYEQIETVGNI